MLRGELVALRARQDSDIPVLDAELYGDVPTWSRVTIGRGGHWRPARTTRRSGWPTPRPTRLCSPWSSWPATNWPGTRCCGESTYTAGPRTWGCRCGRRSAAEGRGPDAPRGRGGA